MKGERIVALFFVVSLVCGMHSKVHADQINDSIQGQVQVVREKSSGTEGLYAVEISDEKAEQIANANQKSMTAEYYAGKDEVVKGDVTGDGKVDIQDLRMILRYVCEKIDTWN